jgi:hypothetical protein
LPSSIRLQGIFELEKASRVRISGPESSTKNSFAKIVVTRSGIQPSRIRIRASIESSVQGLIRIFPPLSTFGRVRFGEIQSGAKLLIFNRALLSSSIRLKGVLSSILPSKINLSGNAYCSSLVRLKGLKDSSIPSAFRTRSPESQTQPSGIRIRGYRESAKASSLRFSGNAAVDIPSRIHITGALSLALPSSIRLKGEEVSALPGQVRIQGTETQATPSLIHIAIYPHLRIFSKTRIRGSREIQLGSWLRIWDRPGSSYFLSVRGSFLRVRGKPFVVLPSSLRIGSEFKASLPSTIRLTAEKGALLPSAIRLGQGVVKPSSLRILGAKDLRISSRVCIKVLKHGDFGLRKFGELPFGSQILRSSSLKSSRVRIRGWKQAERSSRVRLAVGRSSVIPSSIDLSGYALKSLPGRIRISGKESSLIPSYIRMGTGRQTLLPSHLYIYGHEPVTSVDQEPIVTVTYKLIV